MRSLLARRLTTTAALAATALVPLGIQSAASPAGAGTCRAETVYIKGTKPGTSVWIPTNVHYSTRTNPDGWQTGGDQTWSDETGTETSKTKGSADSVEVSGGGKIGPVDVSAAYNREWNRSTSTASSQSRSWSETIDLPDGVDSRTRVYWSGWRFQYTYVVVYEGGAQCTNRSFKRTAVMPDRAKKGQSSMRIELYSKRNQLQSRG